ncbi:MAG: hypothetical protein ABIV48_09780 [Pyrinomonadaceae bacterium]
MLFKPSFCANCGEKIERAEWYIWTSRRFCQVCESEYKGQDLIPRAVVIVGILIGVFGIGSYLSSGAASSDLRGVKVPRKLVEQPSSSPRNTDINSADARTQKNVPPVLEQPEQKELASKTLTALSGQPTKPKSGSVEEVYYCRAETKKGTPCARRVKGNIRCYQHIGMPAMPQPKN